MPTEANPFAPKTLADRSRKNTVEAREAEILFNRHPADELGELREKIKTLQTRADELRAKLLAEGADLKGDEYTAKITNSVRESLDRKAITEAFGEKAVAPFIRATKVQTVNLVEN